MISSNLFLASIDSSGVAHVIQMLNDSPVVAILIALVILVAAFILWVLVDAVRKFDFSGHHGPSGKGVAIRYESRNKPEDIKKEPSAPKKKMPKKKSR